MLLEFKYGFEFDGFIFGWLNKELYRLPSQNKLRHYGLKKLNPIIVGRNIGYCCKRNKFSIEQLKEKTILIDKKFSVIKHKDLPF